MPRNIAAFRESSEKIEMSTYLYGGRYLSTTRKIALEDEKECLTDSSPMQTFTPRRSKKGCRFQGRPDGLVAGRSRGRRNKRLLTVVEGKKGNKKATKRQQKRRVSGPE
jgi:hypothetical protein